MNENDVLDGKSNRVKNFSSFVVTVLIGLILGYLISITVVCRVNVEGVSMEPTYKTGDVLLINRLDKTPERGEIVTFYRGNDKLIKRTIAIPGDTITIKGSSVFVNGEKIKEDYINEETFDGGGLESNVLTLGEDEYFMMGDNRNHSTDSRYFGVVTKDKIIGTKLIDLW